MAKDKVFKFGKQKQKIVLRCEEKEDKAFDYFCNTFKLDAYSMPSKFIASTVYYPETADDTQTFYTQIVADLYSGKELIGTIKESDEFDSRRDAEKWIFKVFRELFLDILEQV